MTEPGVTESGVTNVRTRGRGPGRSTTRRELLWRLWQQLPLLLLLVPLWMVLWGELSWLSFTSGVVVAFFVSIVFYLPPAELSGRINPFWSLVFFGWFLYEVAVGSCHVAWLAFRRQGLRRNALVAAPMATDSDIVTTLTSLVITLIPGSVVVEIDQPDTVLYLHAIDIVDEAEAEQLRAKVRAIERGIVRAIGSRQDLEAIANQRDREATP